MAITVKSLAYGRLTATSDTNLYPATNGTYAAKAAVISNMRFVNTSDTASATLVVKLKRETPSASRRISPSPVTIPPQGLYVLDAVLTLEGAPQSGTNRDAIVAATSSGGQIDYIISGIERDQ